MLTQKVFVALGRGRRSDPVRAAHQLLLFGKPTNLAEARRVELGRKTMPGLFFSLHKQLLKPLAEKLGMTLPRIRPCSTDHDGTSPDRITVSVTRTTSDRRFLLRPSRTVNKIYAYCLFAAAEKHGADVHVLVVMSNHAHAQLTIDADNLSDFNAWNHRHVSQCLIAHYGMLYPKRTLEAVWSKDPPHELLFSNENAILEKTVYLMANPVAARLVPDYKKWPGLHSRPRDWVREEKHCKVYKRPKFYFSETGCAPEQVTARFTIPPAFAEWDPMEYVETVEAMLSKEQRRLRAINAGKKYLGAKAATAVDPFDAPNNKRPRYNRNPIVACGGDKALMQEAMLAIHTFRRSYRAAWNEFKEFGSSIFPAGCFKMRTRFHMPCAEPCFDWCLLAPG